MSQSRSNRSTAADPHSWQLPSSYQTKTSARRETVAILNPTLLTTARTFPSGTDHDLATVLGYYPDINHAAIHLALIECFYRLQQDAGQSKLDQTACPPPAYDGEPTNVSETNRQAWSLLIRVAVDRFVKWWSSIDFVLRHAAAYSHRGGPQVAVQLDTGQLPPLDVLMVWYAFMLDSEAYSAACSVREALVPGLSQLRFPWSAICDAMDLDTLQFSLPCGAARLFSTLSSQKADISGYIQEPPAYVAATDELEVNLFSKVLETAPFFEEAHRILWIRSAALVGSLNRARAHYQSVVLCEKPMALSTPFGVELIWRTHRLGNSYYSPFQDSIKRILRSRTPLPVSGVELAEISQTLSVESMAFCACWTCERIRDNIPYYRHENYGETTTLSSTQLSQIKDDLGFYHAVEKARRSGACLPTRPKSSATHAREQLARQRQDQAGVLPGLHEYVQLRPDGKRKIKKEKPYFQVSAWWW